MLFLLPIIGSLFIFHWKMDHLEKLKAKIDSLHQQLIEIDLKQKKSEAYLSQLKTADSDYLSKHIETLNLLEPEIRRTQVLLQQQKENLPLVRRSEFLKGGKNKIAFTKEKQRSAQKLKEVEEKLDHSVEVGEEDLKKILLLIEGVLINPYSPAQGSPSSANGFSQGKPQLVFREFDLTRQLSASEEEVYVIDFKLIKREAL